MYIGLTPDVCCVYVCVRACVYVCVVCHTHNTHTHPHTHNTHTIHIHTARVTVHQLCSREMGSAPPPLYQTSPPVLLVGV